jgi:hypothetical protein
MKGGDKCVIRDCVCAVLETGQHGDRPVVPLPLPRPLFPPLHCMLIQRLVSLLTLLRAAAILVVVVLHLWVCGPLKRATRPTRLSTAHTQIAADIAAGTRPHHSPTYNMLTPPPLPSVPQVLPYAKRCIVHEGKVLLLTLTLEPVSPPAARTGVHLMDARLLSHALSSCPSK